MATKRKVEVFTAGCPVCDRVVAMVRRIACDACEVEERHLTDRDVATRAEELGIRSVPAVAIDGELASCCAGRGPLEDVLRDAGIGEPL